jgi:2-aminoadipate transaminase
MARVTWMSHTHSAETMRLLKQTPQENVISFAGGLPAQDCIPSEDLEAAQANLPQEQQKQSYQYSWTEGVQRLQEQIAQRMCSRGLVVKTEEILITHGAQQALDILAKYLALNRTAGVMESPTYFPALEVCEVNRLRFNTVSRTETGLAVDRLRSLFSAGSAWMYVVPTGHNPTGYSLNDAQRRQLSALASEFGTLLIEDDVYGQLQYDAQEQPLRQSNTEIIYVGSFSKVLAPGLRVGWIAANPKIIQALLPIKHASDLQTNSLGQAIVSAYLNRFDLDAHIARSREIYRARRDAMVAALEKYFPPEVSWSRPAAGFSLWVQAPLVCSPEDLLKAAMDAGVAFEPGRPFLDKPPEHGLVFRLSFSNETPERIERGIGQLAGVLKSQLNL